MSWVGKILMSLLVLISALAGGIAYGHHKLHSPGTVDLQPVTTTHVDNGSAENWKSFDNMTYDLHFTYPSNGKLSEQSEQQADAPSDNSAKDAPYYTWYAARVDIPVIPADSWQDNSFSVSLYNKPVGNTCADVFPDTYQNGEQAKINGVIFYMTEDPGVQGGAYTVSKSKEYVAETPTWCYSFAELLTSNVNASSSPIETNRDYSTDFKLLDRIMQTVKI
jgi:hypothetical protein